MKTRMILALFYGLLVGCYSGISGRVVDSETSHPIEGAIVVVQWTKKHGFGDYYHTVAKVLEVETDSYGNFNLAGINSPFVESPILIIYKKGYTAWRNDILFPSYIKKRDYDIWEDNYVYKLERAVQPFSREEHLMFIKHGIMIDGLMMVPRFHCLLNSD